MYTPPHNRQEDREQILAFVREFPFATLVSSGEGGMLATHIPLTVSANGQRFTVSGHVARANPQAAHLAAGAEVLAVFAEPHAYISPEHYDAGRSVPTWNYVAVHAYGTPAVVGARDAKLGILAASIAQFEPAFQASLDSYPAEIVDAKLKGIVAFSFEVTRLDARWKLSQDRRPAERERISLAMRLSSDPSARRLAAFMEHPEPAPAR